jgi:O-antigen/teichoic acid export membrane protein
MTTTGMDRRMFPAAALRLIGIGLQFATNAALIPVALGFLGTEEYGLWIVVRSVGLYLGLFAEVGIGQSIVNLAGRATARGHRRFAAAITTNAFGSYVLLSSATLIALVASVVLLNPASALLGTASPQHPEFNPTLLVLGALVLISIPLNVYPAALLATRAVSARQLVDLAGPVLGLVLPVGALVLGGGVLGMALGTGLAQLAPAIAAALVLRQSEVPVQLNTRLIRPRVMGLVLANSGFFLAYGVGLVAQRTLGSLLTARFGALGEVASIYVVILVYRAFAWSVVETIPRVTQPYLIESWVTNRRVEAVEFVRKSTLAATTGAAVFSVILAVVGSGFLGRLLGVELTWNELYYGGLWFTIDATLLPMATLLIGINQHRRLAFVQAVYVALSVAAGALGALLSPQSVLNGILLGFVVAAVGQLALFALVLPKTVVVTRIEFLRQFVMPSAVIIAVGFGLSAVSHAVGADPIGGVAGAVIALAVYALTRPGDPRRLAILLERH